MESSDLIVQSRETIMACKTFAKKIDTDQIRQETASLAENIAAQAERAAVWAAPRVSKARTEVAKAAKEAQLRPVLGWSRTMFQPLTGPPSPLRTRPTQRVRLPSVLSASPSPRRTRRSRFRRFP